MTWKKFYKDVEAIIGRHIDSDKRHDRVCHRKNGPNIIDYLHELPKHIGMARKGYSRGDLWEPFKDHWPGNDFQHHREAQIEYLQARRQYEALQDQIDEYLIEIVELGGTIT